jgi:2-hydroxychromene-2-carboxylate isomerase
MPAPMLFFYSLRSPYAWLADSLLARCLPDEVHAAIDPVPYWDPRPHTMAGLEARRASVLYRPMSRARHMYILGDVKATARRLGFPLAWPVDGPQPDWELPHRACLAAAQGPDRGRALRRALFSARFEQGRDIWSPEVVADVMQQAGVAAPLDTAAASPPPADDAAVSALERGYRLGVFGIPFFVVGREKFWGVDRLPFALREAGLPWRDVAAAWAGEAVQ